MLGAQGYIYKIMFHCANRDSRLVPHSAKMIEGFVLIMQINGDRHVAQFAKVSILSLNALWMAIVKVSEKRVNIYLLE